MLQEAIVIDNGSETSRAGLSGHETPRVVYRVADEGPLHSQIIENNYKDVMVRGVITDWNIMEQIWWDTITQKLKNDPKEHPILITESASTNKSNREKIIQVLFEKFHTPAVYVATPAVLSMYACGRTTGVIIDLGHGTSHVVPIYQGYALPRAAQHSTCAGIDLTEYLMTILRERGLIFTTSSERKIVHDIKEKLCYVGENFDDELLKSSMIEKDYKLPDGNIITIGNERFRCPESLFQPQFLGSAACGLHETIYNTIMNSDMDIRRELFSNIILTGGTTLFPGFIDRIQNELMMLSPTNMQIHLKAPIERQNTAWIGGSVLSSLTLFESMWVTKKEYEESGPSIVHKKCY